MAEPAVADGGESDADGGPSPDTVTDDDGDEEVEMVQTDVSETGADPDGFFDDVEADTEGSDTTADSIFDDIEDGDGSSSDDSPEAADTRSSGLADDINNGCSRLAVFGLDDEWETSSGETRTKQELQDEFKETFEAFRLGHYGSIVVEEYLLVDTEDIHPVWGLCGAMLICAAVVLYRRPDGEQLVSNARTNLGQFDLDKIKKNS